MAIPLRVVLLEDHPPDAELIIRELSKSGYEPQWSVVTTETEFLASLEGAPDVILSDHVLPVFSVHRVLALLQELNLDIPVVVVTGTAGNDRAPDYLKLGAAAYILKDDLVHLPQVVSRTILEHRLKHERERAARDKRKTD